MSEGERRRVHGSDAAAAPNGAGNTRSRAEGARRSARSGPEGESKGGYHEGRGGGAGAVSAGSAEGGGGRCGRWPGRGAHGRPAGALLPHDEGAGAARLLHVGDRLHAGDALRRITGPLRPVHPVSEGGEILGGARLTPVIPRSDSDEGSCM